MIRSEWLKFMLVALVLVGLAVFAELNGSQVNPCPPEVPLRADSDGVYT